MLACPNCSKVMVSLPLESTIGVPILAGECSDCALLWFEASASIRLAPKSVLDIFHTISSAPTSSAVLRSGFTCPRCSGALVFTHDLQRATRFTYWRCPVDHGQLIGFTQFLLEKNFVRPPSVEELEKLRRDVREITCSQCGAPIDLQKDSACPYCHAPIALIDPDGLAAAVCDLRAKLAPSVPAALTKTVSAPELASAQMDAILDPERIRQHVGRHDLLAIGLGAVAGLLASVI